MSRLLVFGYGYAGRALARRLKADGWTIAATHRRPEEAAVIVADGAAPIALDALAPAVAQADAILITAPPREGGCPGLAALQPLLSRRRPWVGFLSTTGVYGDRAGGWAFEADPPTPLSLEGHRRAEAEAGWLALGAAIFRLPGIYGPGRSAFDRLREGTARRIVRPGQVFSRVHVDDLAAGVAAAIARPRPGAIFNLCDDAPAPNAEVIAHAAHLLGVPVPPEEPYETAILSPAARRFYEESKRVSNAQAKAELAWRPAYPTYREGLAAILATEKP